MNAEKLDRVPRKASRVFEVLFEFLRPVDAALLRVPKWVPVVSFFLVSLLILLAGYAGASWHAGKLDVAVKKDLLASVDAKIARILDWLAERRSDVAALVKDPSFSRDVEANLLPGPSGADRGGRIEARMRAVRDAYRYKDILLLDAEAAVRVRSSPDARSPSAHEMMRAREAISSGETQLADLHYDTREGSKIYLCALIAPVRNPSAGTAAIGAVIFRIDPAVALFPILDSPLGPWDSAETLFAREEHGNIVYLKELRRLGAPPVTVRRSVDEPTLLAALAARGNEGALKGTDYRGVAVVGVARKVPGTPWIVVGKVDSEELYATLLRESRIVGLVLALFVLGAAAAAALWWRAIIARASAAYYRLRVEREALRQHYANQVEYANDSIMLLDDAGRILDVNERALDAYGYGRAELLGANVRMLRSFTARDRIDALFDGWDEGGRIYETWHRRSDGSVFPVEVSGRAFRIEGGVFYQKIVRDITDRRNAEERLVREHALLESLLDALPGIFYMFNKQGTLLRWNANLVKMSGRPAEVLSGTNVLEFAPKEQREDAERAIRMALASAQSGLEGHLLGTDGTRTPFYFSNIRIETADGPVVIGVGIDISARLKVERELRRLNEALEQRVAERTVELENANRELNAFSYTVAHDLQAPLRHVAGFLGIALEDHGAEMHEEARLCVERAIRAAHNMSDMIRALLEFSRVTRAELHPERVALDNLVSEVVSEFAPEGSGRRIEWRIGPLPAVMADRHLLRMVVSNLISNAIKFTKHRSTAVIEIGTQAGPESGQRESVVFVRDNGAGFSMEAASRLFEPFQRLHAAREFEGTGIGLATCRRLIERHGGRMWAESIRDAGATFFFALSNGISGSEHPAAADIRRT